MSLFYQVKYKVSREKEVTQIEKWNKILSLKTTHVVNCYAIIKNCIYKDFYGPGIPIYVKEQGSIRSECRV